MNGRGDVPVASALQPSGERGSARDATAIALGFFLAELAAVVLSTPNVFATVWPPNGFLLAMLLRRDRRAWPRILLATYPANLCFTLIYGQPVVVGSAYWMANVAEVSCAAWVLLRFWPDGFTLRDLRQVAGFALVTVGAAVVGAAIGAAATSVWHPDAPFDASAFTWWAADMLGMLTVAPVIITWDRGRDAQGRRTVSRECAALAAILGLLTAATLVPIVTGRHDIHVPFPILVIPLLTWAALRLGPAATAWPLLMLNSLTLLRHLHGLGDVFAAGGFTLHNAAALQILLGSLSVTFLAIAVAAEASREAVVTLTRRDDERTGYLAEVTHEIRNPLATILAAVEIAQEAGPGTAQASQAFTAIKRGAARILAISDEVLTLTRSERNPDVVQREACWLPALWRALQADCEALPRLRDVELRWSTPAPNVTIAVDRRRLEVILHNLVGNALKFTDQGIVDVSCSLGERELLITVRDTGIGIPAEDHGQIFELYQRGHSPEANARRGTGVGLHTVRQYANQLGGNVSVSSVHGAGSMFTVRLPLQASEAAGSSRTPRTA